MSESAWHGMHAPIYDYSEKKAPRAFDKRGLTSLEWRGELQSRVASHEWWVGHELRPLASDEHFLHARGSASPYA